jgi:hypothetical protein
MHVKCKYVVTIVWNILQEFKFHFYQLHPNVIFPETLKFLKLGLLTLWKPITFCANLRLKQNLKQSYKICQELSKDIQHATCTHVMQGDSQLLMVGNQIDTLIINLSFNHNLCYKYSNGSCELILNIYILRAFHWYKEVFNPMSFDPSNHCLNIQNSIRTHSLTLSRIVKSVNIPKNVNMTPGLHSWPAPFHAFALVASPKLGSW